MTRSWLVVFIAPCLLAAILSQGRVSAQTEVTIDAAYTLPDKVVLISGSQALHLSTDSEKKEISVENHVIQIPVQAVFREKSNLDKILVYGKTSGQHLMIDGTLIRRLNYGRVRRFIRSGGPDAAGYRGQTVYFFKGCEMVTRKRWNRWSRPQQVEAKGLPCSPDAAWSDGNDMIILKGDQIWRWTDSDKVFGPCPFSDTYSITSWKLKSNPDVGSPCPDGWTVQCSSNKCFKLFLESTDYAPPAEARRLCQAQKGDLATIRSQAEQDTIQALVAENPKDYHIGLTDLKKEGVFSWLDEDTPTQYTFWGRSQPDNAGDSEHCTDLYGSWTGFNYGWFDVSCQTYGHFICERPMNA